MQKPVVKFKGNVNIIRIPSTEDRYAIIEGVLDHPHLGEEEYVRTSRVLDHEVMPDGEIVAVITQNTIYRKV